LGWVHIFQFVMAWVGLRTWVTGPVDGLVGASCRKWTHG